MAKASKYDAVAGRGKSDSSLFTFIDLSDYPDIKPLKYSKSGDYSLDIIPYTIKTKKHPLVAEGKASVGDEHFILDVWIHQNVGPKKRTLICPRDYGKTCPICDHISATQSATGRDSTESKALSKLWRKHKAVYFVVDPEEPGQLRLFETSFKNFQDELQKKASRAGKKDGLEFIPYGERDGCTVNFYVEMVKNEAITNPYPEFKDFEFTSRKKGTYDDEFFDSVPSLDELMITYTTDEVQKFLDGESSDDDEDDEEEAEEKPAKKGKSDDEEEEAPRTRRKPISEDEDDKKPSEPKCPAKGGKFGVDIDTFDECDKCEIASECSAKYRANRRANR
jgi:hypothetical protein